MAKLRVWERRVVENMNERDPEEKELVDRFNADFTRIFRATPKPERRLLFDMLYTINKLCNRESVKMFKLGIRCGYMGGIKCNINRANKHP